MNDVLLKCWLIELLFFLTGFSIMRRGNSFYYPAGWLFIVWTSVIFLSLILAPEYYYSPQALLCIYFLVFLFYTGFLIASKKHCETKEVLLKKRIALHRFEKFLAAVTMGGIISGILSVVFLLREAGAGLANIFDKENLMSVCLQLTEGRYQGERLSKYTMLLLLFSYAACYGAGALLSVSSKIKLRVLSVSVLLPVLVFTYIYTARATFLFALFPFLIAWLVTRVYYCQENRSLLSLRNVISGCIVIISMGLLFILTQAVRMGFGNLDFHAFTVITNHLKVWFAGSLSGFSIWYDSMEGSAKTFGMFTFAGISELMGFSFRLPGIFTAAYDLDGMMAFSNIFTLFRYLFTDFGVIATGLMMILTGFFSARLTSKILRNSISSIVLLTGLLYALFFYHTSIFAYNTVLFSWLLVYIIFFCFEKYAENEYV